MVSYGFLRLTTRRGVFAQPLSVETAVGLIEQWSSLSQVHALVMCERSRALTWRWMRELGVAGNLCTGMQIAALAYRERATVYSNDTDFQRVQGLSVCNPLVD